MLAPIRSHPCLIIHIRLGYGGDVIHTCLIPASVRFCYMHTWTPWINLCFILCLKKNQLQEKKSTKKRKKTESVSTFWMENVIWAKYKNRVVLQMIHFGYVYGVFNVSYEAAWEKTQLLLKAIWRWSWERKDPKSVFSVGSTFRFPS